jgi:hypothetical protein
MHAKRPESGPLPWCLARRLWFLLMACAAGCGAAADVDATEQGKVSNLVSEVADAAARDQSLQALFTTSSKPPKQLRQQYARYSFRALEPPVVEADKATIKVRVRHARNDAEAGEVEWTAVKEGDAWKLEQAPLPAKKAGA